MTLKINDWPYRIFSDEHLTPQLVNQIPGMMDGAQTVVEIRQAFSAYGLHILPVLHPRRDA